MAPAVVNLQDPLARWVKATAGRPRLLAVGGSAGSFPLVGQLLEALPQAYPLPVVLCLHRLKDKREGFTQALGLRSTMPVLEPDDKGPAKSGYVYVAPANYHLMLDAPGSFSLGVTELVQYSRPSIDVLFESVADAYGPGAIGVLFSGANRDGAVGMRRIHRVGGLTLVQDPADATMGTMPLAALELMTPTCTATAVMLTQQLVMLGQAIMRS